MNKLDIKIDYHIGNMTWNGVTRLMTSFNIGPHDLQLMREEHRNLDALKERHIVKKRH